MNARRAVAGWAALVALAVWLLGCNGFFPDQNTTISFPVYAANSGASNVSGFKLDPSSGALTAATGSPFAAATGPAALGTNSTGTYLYAANTGTGGANGGVSGWTVNSDASMTAMSGSPFASSSGFASIAVDPQARYVYAGAGNAATIQGFTASASTGVLTAMSGTTATTGTPVRMTEDPAGKFLFVAEGASGVDVFTIGSGGALTKVQNVPLAAANGVAATSSTLYVADGTTGANAYSINSSTGQLTALGSALAAGTTPSNIAVAPSGAYVFITSAGSNDVSAYTVGSTGALTAVSGSPFSSGTGPAAVTVDPSSRYVYVVNKTAGSISIFTISTSTPGALSASGTATAGSSPNDVVVVPIS